MRSLQRKQLLAAGVFVASTLVLAIQLITPSPVMVTVGENGTNVAELGSYFRYPDVAVIAVAGCLLGASGTYLLVGSESSDTADESSAQQPVSEANRETEPSDELLDARREEWEQTAERLANNEEVIYETVLEADGVLPQSDIVERTDLSKATVSRSLDSLETKNLVERKRRGMGNVIMLL
jgi:uncharacterized membrane protein